MLIKTGYCFFRESARWSCLTGGFTVSARMSRCLMPVFIFFILAPVASCDRSVQIRYDVRTEESGTYFDRGSLKYDHGIPVLVLEGSPAQMGLQYGVLLRKPLQKSLAMMDEIINGVLEERPWYQRLLFPAWKSWYTRTMGKRIPERYLEELHGIAEGSGIDYETVLFVATGAGIFDHFGCTSAVVKTSDGILHGRNLDWMPLSLGNTPLIIEYRPSDRQRYTSFTMVGVPGCVQGINEKGLTLSTNIAFRLRAETPDNDGMPVMYKNREVLESASSLDAAQKLYMSWHTDECGWMITMSSLSEKDGAIIEMFDNNVVRTGLADGRVSIHNILFNPALLGKTLLSRRYTEIRMGLGEYNVSRQRQTEKIFSTVKDVDSMLDYLSSSGLLGIDDLVMSDNSGINNPSTINTMVFDAATGSVYYSTAPGLSAFSRIYRYDIRTHTLKPYRDQRIQDKNISSSMDVFARILELWIMGKYGEIVRIYDTGTDNVPVMLMLAVKSWLKKPSSRDVRELIHSADLHIARHPEYGLYHLLKGQLLAASGRKSDSIPELKAALDSSVIAGEDRLLALLLLCDITEGDERKSYRKRYVNMVNDISETWHVEEHFARPWREMKKEFE